MVSFFGLGKTIYYSSPGADTVFVTIKRTGDLSEIVDVSYITNDFTAIAGEDYVAIPDGVVRFDPGVSEVEVVVELLPNPNDTELQSFSLTLINASGSGALQTPRTAQILLNATEEAAGNFPIDTIDVNFVPVISGIQRPIDIAFMPNDPTTFFVGQQPGLVSIVQGGALLPTPLLDMREFTNFVQDRGLMSIAIHPNLEQHPYLYVAAVIDPPDVDRTGATATTNDDANGRGSRYSQLLKFELDPATNYTSIIPGNEIAGAARVILGADVTNSLDDVAFRGIYDYGSSQTEFGDPELFPASGADRIGSDFIRIDSLSHALGDLVFDADGNLFVTVGDGSVFNYADRRAIAVQDLNTLEGKILRIDPLTGQGLASNPFADPSNGLDDNIDKIYQLGVRNPFRAALREDGELFFADVGWFTFEEINNGPPGANFGWPFYEGGLFGQSARTPVYRNFEEAAAFYDAVASGAIEITAPLLAFSHRPDAPGFNANALMVGDFFTPGGPYPSFLDNYLLFGDIVSGRTFIVDTYTPNLKPFLISDAAPFIVDWTTAPDGRIWYASLFAGTVGFLEISGTLPPTEPTEPTFRIDFGNNGATDIERFVFNGSAALVGGALRLTPEVNRQAGSIFYVDPLIIDADTSFATQFSFELGGGGGNTGGQGFTFVLQNDPTGSEALGFNAWAMGLGGRNADERITNSLAVTFDTFQNDFDVSDNQIAVIVDGRVAFSSAPRVDLPKSVLELNGGDLGYAWIDYDGLADRLAVFVGNTSTKPLDPVLVVDDLQLDTIVGNQAYAGFTASTGSNNNFHDLLNWTFIQDPDEAGAARTLAITALDAIGPEGGPGSFREFTFLVTRSGDLFEPTTVDWRVDGIGANGGADADDFHGRVLPSGQITFAPGQSTHTLKILVRGDNVIEEDEAFRVSLSNASNAAIPFGFADGLILNDDFPPGLSFEFPGFPEIPGDVGLRLNGSAALVGGDLQLTAAASDQRGSAFLDQALDIDADSSFNTSFSFQIDGGNDGGQGFTFVLQNDPAGSDALGWLGWAMGLGGRNANERITNSLAVTFDTFQNHFDVSDNQIAVIVDGRVPLSSATRVDLPKSVLELNGGDVGYAWIDYDGLADRLAVFVGDTATRPLDPILVVDDLQLDAIVGNQAYVGFTASTSQGTFPAGNTHRILDWQFTQGAGDTASAPPPFLAYSDFTDITTMNLNGSASVDGGRLLLTPATNTQAGSAFHLDALQLGETTSISTQFAFQLGGNAEGAEGFTFVLQNDPDGSAALGRHGWAMGVGGSLDERITNSVAITFDTFQNPFDISDNQLALIVDGRVPAANAPRVDVPLSVFNINSGDLGYAWIDYDGMSEILSVFLSNTQEKPNDPLFEAAVNLYDVVGSQAYAGFTASTGGNNNEHAIMSWLLHVEDNLVA